MIDHFEYVNYPLGTMVEIKETKQIGEAFESALGFITVFVGDDDNSTCFELDEVTFL